MGGIRTKNRAIAFAVRYVTTLLFFVMSLGITRTPFSGVARASDAVSAPDVSDAADTPVSPAGDFDTSDSSAADNGDNENAETDDTIDHHTLNLDLHPRSEDAPCVDHGLFHPRPEDGRLLRPPTC